jgi:hypothetical protein
VFIYDADTFEKINPIILDLEKTGYNYTDTHFYSLSLYTPLLNISTSFLNLIFIIKKKRRVQMNSP